MTEVKVGFLLASLSLRFSELLLWSFAVFGNVLALRSYPVTFTVTHMHKVNIGACLYVSRCDFGSESGQ